MINGADFLLYSRAPEADQAVLREILGSRAVGAGEGRLILALPPAEIATHAGSGEFVQRHAEHDLLGLVLYLMCDDLAATVASLAAKGIRCSAIEATEFGSMTTIRLPSGGALGLFQPTYETAVGR